MAEIELSKKTLAMLRKAEAEGKKCVIINDLMINMDNGRWVVTNAHTGKEFTVLNWT